MDKISSAILIPSRFLTRLARDRRGTVAVILALALFAIVGFAGLGTEVASWYYTKRAMQGAADSAASSAAAKTCGSHFCGVHGVEHTDREHRPERLGDLPFHQWHQQHHGQRQQSASDNDEPEHVFIPIQRLQLLRRGADQSAPDATAVVIVRVHGADHPGPRGGAR
jgi:hypothetical protein